MVEKEIKSIYLNELMTLRIYQPESFSLLYKYNICIMQDGDDYYQLGRIATVSDRLHDSNVITDTIFVGIHYKDKHDRKKKYHPSGDQQKAYIKFLAHEVVPLLDEVLPTYLMGSTRALIGDSLAGTLALMAALTYPHTFGKVMMQSPYVDNTVLDKLKTVAHIQTIDIYHTIGTNETAVNTTDGAIVDFLTSNRELSERIKVTGLSYRYNELESGEHTWKYWQQDLARALSVMFC